MHKLRIILTGILLLTSLLPATLVNAQEPATGAIHVEKYHDLNMNGQRDEGEPGLPSWHFTLKDGDGNPVADGDTDEEGKLSFTGLPPGSYEVCEELPDGWVNSDPGNTCQTVIISSGTAEPGPDEATLTTDGNSYLIEFLGTSDGGKTWTYRVTELEGKDLSHWILGLCMTEDEVVDWSPGADDAGILDVEVVDPDPTTGVSGIKWDVKDDYNNDGNDSGDAREFSFTLANVYPVGTTEVGIKTDGTATGSIAGPHCGGAPSEATVVFGNHEEKSTAVTMPASAFVASGSAGQVTLAWATTTELDNAGFNLYRATSPDGPWTQVNEALIAAQGDIFSGASYSFVDTPGYGTFYYQLENVDYYGATSLHGLVMVDLGPAIRAPRFRPSLPEF